MSVTWRRVKPSSGGLLENVTLTHVIIGGSGVALTGASVSVAGTEPPQPTTNRLLGIYSGRGNEGQSLTYFGRYPDAYSNYFQINELSSMSTTLGTLINEGISPIVTLSLKGGKNSSGQDIYHQALAQGPTHPNYTAASDLIDSYISRLDALSKIDTNITVRAAVESEMDAKINQGDLTCTTTQGGKSLNVFTTRCRTGAPNVKTGLWFAGTQHTLIQQIMAQVTLVDEIWGDPYTNQAGVETALQNFNGWLDWLRSTSDYTRLGSPPCGITEFGMSVTTQPHTDAQIAAYLTDLRSQIEAADLQFAILFDQPKDKDHEITDGEHPLSVAAFAASLAG